MINDYDEYERELDRLAAISTRLAEIKQQLIADGRKTRFTAMKPFEVMLQALVRKNNGSDGT